MEDTNNNTNKVTLDGNEVSKEQLAEAQKNKATKVVEKDKGSFVTLQKLRGRDD